MSILKLEHVSVAYEQGLAIEDVTFSIAVGEQVALIGPNGAGKSTLMKAIMGLVPLQTGHLHIEGGLGRLGYVPQYDQVDWDFPVSVLDVVLMGLTRQVGWLRWPNKQHRSIALSAIERVGMSALAGRQIGDLSGGQRRRVFIARALAQQADLLLLDEPFAGVDVAAQNELMATLDALNADGITLMLSTHDLALAFNRFQSVLAINQRCIAHGTAQAVYTPQVLRELYGGRFAEWDEGQKAMLFIDSHTHD